MERLLKVGAKINAPGKDFAGRTALQAAAGSGHMPIVEYLLKEGAEVNMPASSSNGRTALQAAAGGGHLVIVEHLLNGAPRSIRRRQHAMGERHSRWRPEVGICSLCNAF